MWPYYPDLLETPVPRYTSFPTAAEFCALDPELYRHSLENVSGPVSLYVHIPFCEKICFYCGCNTGAAGRTRRLDAYMAALHREIELVASLLPNDVTVGRIAFGGGSPNAISPIDFVRLIDGLTIHFKLSDPVMSIELDPRTMTADWADVVGMTGIRRASLGVQTFASHCQQAIGRVQDDALIEQTVDWLRGAGVSSLNFDLMYGLPHQSLDDLIDTLGRTVNLGADRLALFGYAHVPHIIPRQKAVDASHLPDQRERFAMAAVGYMELCERGYRPVGFDHFAAPDDPLAKAAERGEVYRNFQGFTDDDSGVLIGLGSSAISSFPGLLAQNDKNSGAYRNLASQMQLTANRGIVRSHEDRRRGDIIEQLLCQGRAHLPAALRRDVIDRLGLFLERDLARMEGDELQIIPDGLPYARTISAMFDPYREQSLTRFSSAV